MAAEDKINFRKTLLDIIEWQPKYLAVVRIEQRRLAVGDNRSRISRKQSELKRVQLTPFPQLEFSAMRNFRYVCPLDRTQIAHHPRSRNFWNQKFRIRIK